MVMLMQPGTSLPQARKQLSLWYGHVAVGKTQLLDQFFDLYEDWLKKTSKEHDPATFRHWVLEEYQGGWCHCEFEQFTPLQKTARKNEPLGYHVIARNRGTKDWQLHALPQAGMHLAYQVWDGESLLAEGRAGMYEGRIAPGEALDVTLVLRPMPKAGRFRLIVDMVEEQHCWFYQAGSEPHEEELVISE
jgi:hypothetical protein